MGKAILCVDDEKIITDSLKTQIKNYLGNDYEIETAESGEEAIDLLEELIEEGHEVPLIISDYMMPGLKGDELLIKVNTMAPQIIKILLTGQATIEGVTNAINHANLYRYISKPWVKEDIELAINEAIKSYMKDRQIENQYKELQQWASAFIETMGTVLDRRDTTTAGHSNRLAAYAVKLARKINDTSEGVYHNVSFTEEEIQELYFAALLHDIGKIGVRESVLLKQYRLSTEKQAEIIARFNWIRTSLELKQMKLALNKKESALLYNIDEYLEFVLTISKCDFIKDEDSQKIKNIAETSYEDHEGLAKKLLTEFEQTNLLVKKGNLTHDERSEIETHAEHTYSILKGLPWPKNLENVPSIAASHHEKLNGTGYYKGLKADDIPMQARILALLDIYEALTASDRTYKGAKSHQEAIKILEYEATAGNLDKDILEIFTTMND